MDTGDTLSEGYQALVRSQGDEVLIHTAHCVEWKLTNVNCSGCKSELGCIKSVAMLGVSITPMMYKPTDYNNYELMRASMQQKLDTILKAQSPEEIRSIRW